MHPQESLTQHFISKISGAKQFDFRLKVCSAFGVVYEITKQLLNYEDLVKGQMIGWLAGWLIKFDHEIVLLQESR
jgi:hypothetical protein